MPQSLRHRSKIFIPNFRAQSPTESSRNRSTFRCGRVGLRDGSNFRWLTFWFVHEFRLPRSPSTTGCHGPASTWVGSRKARCRARFQLTFVQGVYYSAFSVGCVGIVYSVYNLVKVFCLSPFVLRVNQTFSRASPRPSRHLHRFNPIKSRLAPPPFFLRLRKPTMTLCALWHISHGHTLHVATSLKSVRIVPLGGYVCAISNESQGH